MTDTIRIALAQVNPTVGAVSQNLDLARSARATAAAQGADIVVYPELFLSGYPPEDLVMKNAFVDACAEAVAALAADTADGGPAILIGAPLREGEARFNAVFALDGGETVAVRTKHFLPNYGVFDEIRVFTAGPLPAPIELRGARLGVPVCEDIWYPDVCRHLKQMGAEVLVVPNGSPFDRTKPGARAAVVAGRVAETGLALLYVNQVGGQDELVFDGTSFVIGPDGAQTHRFLDWHEEIATITLNRADGVLVPEPGVIEPHETGLAAIWQAMVLGLRDYVEKNRFPGVLLGLSGGIDSAVTAAVAVDALGAGRVETVMLPYRYTSSDSLSDAEQCAKALGVRYSSVPIAPAVEAFGEMLREAFGNKAPDIAEENIQSRARGLALMALSNKFGAMVLTTGNKSEVSVGYATLYGDMAGGYNALKDIYKTQVFALARWRNENHPDTVLGPPGVVIPDNIITKPPTAELREDQKDEDSLPPYEVLDAILEGLIENEMSVEDIVAQGFEFDTVARIEHLLYVAEYKRRQAAPGVKVSAKQFGRDRRYPITNGFRDARREKKS